MPRHLRKCLTMELRLGCWRVLLCLLRSLLGVSSQGLPRGITKRCPVRAVWMNGPSVPPIIYLSLNKKGKRINTTTEKCSVRNASISTYRSASISIRFQYFNQLQDQCLRKYYITDNINIHLYVYTDMYTVNINTYRHIYIHKCVHIRVVGCL